MSERYQIGCILMGGLIIMIPMFCEIVYRVTALPLPTIVEKKYNDKNELIRIEYIYPPAEN